MAFAGGTSPVFPPMGRDFAPRRASAAKIFYFLKKSY
jgi:hypothetical protein